MYPSEYVYSYYSVTRNERTSANCSYSSNGYSYYVHCDGLQLRLCDSDLGSQWYYSSSYYYVWSAGWDRQLLFIFPTTVSLTTITLHYYSDSVRGLPELTFYAVPVDFNVWDAPTMGTPRVDVAAVPPGGEPAGRKSVSISVNFNTKKVLMYKYWSSFKLSVSEVEFFMNLRW